MHALTCVPLRLREQACRTVFPAHPEKIFGVMAGQMDVVVEYENRLVSGQFDFTPLKQILEVLAPGALAGMPVAAMCCEVEVTVTAVENPQVEAGAVLEPLPL